jgi:uncharacterized protein YjbI with pentapeptide repeats
MTTPPPLPSDQPNVSSNGSAESGPERPRPTRYSTMPLLTAGEPMAPDEFQAVLAAHQEFIHSGGAGGRWETVVTDDNPDSGVVFGVYLDAKATAGEQADLGHQRLEGLDLKGVALPYADLTGCVCMHQDLTGADLRGSLCIDADLTGTNFAKARLARTDFSRSELAGCNFRGADLTNADFENANLTGADLRGAKLASTRFTNAVMERVLRD